MSSVSGTGPNRIGQPPWPCLSGLLGPVPNSLIVGHSSDTLLTPLVDFGQPLLNHHQQDNARVLFAIGFSVALAELGQLFRDHLQALHHRPATR